MLGLVRFAAALREIGVRLGTSEVLDAASSILAVSIEDRNQVKAALSAALAKSPEEKALFDRAFNAFFVSHEKKQSDISALTQKIDQERLEQELADNELLFQGESLGLSSETKAIYARLGREDKDRLLEFLDKASAGRRVGPEFKPLIESIVEGHLERLRSRSFDPDDGISRTRRTGDPEVDAALMQAALAEPDDQEKLLMTDVASVTDSDLAKFEAVMREISKRLATRFSRRLKRSSRRAAIDIRKTIRANMKYGGVPFTIKYRAPRVERPSLIVISDVSGSMARYTGFLVQFLLGISSVVQNVEVFIFSEDLERVTGIFKEGGSLQDTMSLLLERTRQWGKGTDLGKALYTFRESYGFMCTRKTVVIVLSDGKTMAKEAARRHLGDIHSKVRLILWLNPLRREDWKKVPQLRDFREVSRMFQSRSIADLERIMRTEVLL